MPFRRIVRVAFADDEARQMLARNYTPEGYGPGPYFPIMCEVR